jgi:primosomal protein N'
MTTNDQRPTTNDRQSPSLRASVVLVPSPGRLAPLDYRLPPESRVAPGTRALVPLGTRRSMGVVIDVGAAAAGGSELRDVISVLDDEPVLDESLLRLVHWMADYYLSSLGEAFATALPGALRVDTERVVGLRDAAVDLEKLPVLQQRIVAALADGECSAAALARRVGAGTTGALRRLQQRGIVSVVERLRREVAPTRRLRVYEAAVKVGGDDERLARRAALRAVYAYLRDHPLRRAPHELRHSFANAAAKLRELIAVGLVRMRKRRRNEPCCRRWRRSTGRWRSPPRSRWRSTPSSARSARASSPGCSGG